MIHAIKKSGFWSAMIALLMAAQLGLAFHSLEHKFNAGTLQGDDCALCQVASTMAPGPTAEPIAAPNFYVLVTNDTVAVSLPRVSASPAGFRSRAPPHIVSV
jgi:hypothetical protein